MPERHVRLSRWCTPRAAWALAALALLLACSPGFPPLAPLAMVLIALLVIATLADALLLPAPALLRIEREVPPYISLRRAISIRYTFENRSARTLSIEADEAPLRTLQAPESAMRALLPPRAQVACDVAYLPRARGSEHFGPIYLTYRSPFGLARVRAVYELPLAFRVYPDLSAVERYGSLHVRNRLVEAGLRRLRLRGSGSEFESVRDYEAGDAFRSIDWKASARRGKLMVTQHEIERSQDVLVLLDCGRLMSPRIDRERKLDYAITAGLSVASIASLASDRVGLVAFAGTILVARAPRAASASVQALAAALCDVEPRFEESDYAQAFAYVRSHLHRRSLIVFFTDVIDPVSQSGVLAELRTLARRHVVLCVFMNDAAVADRLATVPARVDDAYAAAVAVGLAQERAVAAKRLRREGVLVIDAPARALSVAAIDEYLRVKARGLL